MRSSSPAPGPGRSGHGREFAVLALICLLAFLIRLAYVITLQPRSFWFDGENYSRLATGLLEHGSYLNDRGRPSAYWPPGYPLFLAAISLALPEIRIANDLSDLRNRSCHGA